MNADEIAKATEQIKRTKEIFDTKLTSPDSENSLQYRFYRNFIAQLAVISAEKLNLYNVWSSQDWEKIVNTDVRGKLLNDDLMLFRTNMATQIAVHTNLANQQDE